MEGKRFSLAMVPVRLRSSGRLLVMVFASVVLLTQAACLTSKSYVDPELKKVVLQDLEQRENPAPIYLIVEFQTNGKPNLRATNQVFDQVTATLRSTGMFTEVRSAASDDAATMQIVMNNVADMGSAVGKGIGTGLTLGLAGSMVTDGYVFTATFTAPGMEPVIKEYKHAIHTTIGNKRGPQGLTPVPIGQAFDQVVRDLVLNLLEDLQTEGHL